MSSLSLPPHFKIKKKKKCDCQQSWIWGLGGNFFRTGIKSSFVGSTLAPITAYVLLSAAGIKMRSFLQVLEPGLPVERPTHAHAWLDFIAIALKHFLRNLVVLSTKLCASSSDIKSQRFLSLTSLERESRPLKRVGRNFPKFALGIHWPYSGKWWVFLFCNVSFNWGNPSTDITLG